MLPPERRHLHLSGRTAKGCTPGRAVNNLSKSKAGSPATPTSGLVPENRVKPSSDDPLLVEKVTDGAG